MVTLTTMALLMAFYSGGCHCDNLLGIAVTKLMPAHYTRAKNCSLSHTIEWKKNVFIGEILLRPTLDYFVVFNLPHHIFLSERKSLWKKISRFSKGCCSKVVSQRSGRAKRSWRLNSPLPDRLQNWPRKNFDQSAISRSSLQDRTNGR